MKIPIALMFGFGMILCAACQPALPAGSGVDSTRTEAPPLSTPTPPVPSSTRPPVIVDICATPSIPTLETTPVPPFAEIPPEAQPLIDLAVQMLVRKTGIPPDQIHVLQVTAVTWRDASLGCPKPGVDYIRLETPGYNILLEARGNTYPFHTDLTNRVVQCASKPPGDIFLPP